MKIIDEDTVMYHGLNGKSEDYKTGYFDAMAAHDNAPTVINSIIKLRPQNKDVIVVTYNMNEIDIKEMRSIHTAIQEEFSDNTVIGIPDKVSMECCDQRSLNLYLDAIKNAQDNHRY